MLRSACLALLGGNLAACGGSSKPTTTEPATAKVLVLVDDQGVGVGGFASAENKQAFDGAHAKYTPAYGGYCAFAASQNRLSEADPTV
ncbi:MAG TPA: hypothetical protein VK427_15630 [Kofleriaceae bacterium]|nr:hypothetical protein [Kofleriaceae bacterium]